MHDITTIDNLDMLFYVMASGGQIDLENQVRDAV